MFRDGMRRLASNYREVIRTFSLLTFSMTQEAHSCWVQIVLASAALATKRTLSSGNAKAATPNALNVQALPPKIRSATDVELHSYCMPANASVSAQMALEPTQIKFNATKLK